MNLEQIRENLRNQGAKVADLSARLAKAASDDKLDIAAVTKLQDELAAEQARYNALKAAASVDQPQPEALKPTKEDRTRSDMLKSNEYARAFAFAIRNGLTPATGRGREETQVLFDAMTIGGGDPAGTDGGFLVPTDIDTQIHEKLKEIAPLINYFGHEMVQAQAGWRVTDTAPTSGFSSINEAATVPSNQQPAFAKVTYSLTKYGLIVPVSNELMADETANLFAYLARWYAKKAAITINGLFLGVLDDLDSGATEIANNAILKGVKTLLNVNIDPAHAANAVLITNQDGFNELDAMEDTTGRPLIQTNIADATPRLFGRHPVIVLGNGFLASSEANAGTSTPAKAPIYVGDAAAYATLFERAPMELLSTNIGGTAFTTDTTQVRGLFRACVSKFDTAAMAAGKIALA